MDTKTLAEAISRAPGLTQALEAVFVKGANIASFDLAKAKNSVTGMEMDYHVIIADGFTMSIIAALVKAMGEAQLKYAPAAAPAKSNLIV